MIPDGGFNVVGVNDLIEEGLDENSRKAIETEQNASHHAFSMGEIVGSNTDWEHVHDPVADSRYGAKAYNE